MTEHAVVVAGGGPTGLMLAGELALAGVEVAIVERRPSQDLAGNRAGGLHARSLELLDQRGIADRFLAEGKAGPAFAFATIPLRLDSLPSRHNYVLSLWQHRIEAILAGWVGELGVPTRFGAEITGFAQDDAGVDIALADGGTLRAGWLVGCDGGRSIVRKTAGIAFPGWEATTSSLLAVVETADEPAWGFRRDERGLHGLGRMEDGRQVRVMLTEAQVGAAAEPTLDDLRAALVEVYGTDFGVHSPVSISRFSDNTRQAVAYRERRVLLAGDAAHVHPPDGGQGLQTGLHDAVNLGWKLARVVHGTSPEALLDTYHAERHPVAARMLRRTMAQVALRRPDDRTDALRDLLGEVLALDGPQQRLAEMASGLDIAYDLGPGHPLLGQRMPDLDLGTAAGPTRVAALLRDGRPLLLNLGHPGVLDRAHTPWVGKVRLAAATAADTWHLPVVGPVAAPAAVLVRPDGHLAWAGDGTDAGLRKALGAWFGPT